ncbi:hypothetical protein [Gimesia chilikensis]|uniref:Uncharacterized protein n=1 Tax=Gimesia chilikensis TaxID=2605989 RepID=A0A517PKJ4_9PLAN|nr:hypothetical protein [Gimesia chilikensis]QDT19898.1 hypothetical protein HG66A1_16660 [Gimesia chilikensis]
MRRTIRAIVSVLILSLLFYLIITTESPNRFNQLLIQNYELLLPDGAEATVPLVTKTDWSRTAEWTINTNQSWQEYRIWLNNQVGGTYRVLSETEREISLRKTYHSEIYDIKLSVEEDGNIHVVYSLSLW